MKTKPFFLFLSVLFIGFSSCKKEPVYEIKDEYFLNYLIEQGVDTNGDGVISGEEASVVKKIELEDWDQPVDFKGIEMFINLEVLSLFCINVKNLNLTQNAELIEVRYLRTTDDLYLRIYLYDPAVHTTSE